MEGRIVKLGRFRLGYEQPILFSDFFSTLSFDRYDAFSFSIHLYPLLLPSHFTSSGKRAMPWIQSDFDRNWQNWKWIFLTFPILFDVMRKCFSINSMVLCDFHHVSAWVKFLNGASTLVIGEKIELEAHQNHNLNSLNWSKNVTLDNQRHQLGLFSQV